MDSWTALMPITSNGDSNGQMIHLFLIGRDGMHKYNNQDHSMLTAMVSVDNILAGITSKENLWDINTEQKYHESKSKQSPATHVTQVPADAEVAA